MQAQFKTGLQLDMTQQPQNYFMEVIRYFFYFAYFLNSLLAPLTAYFYSNTALSYNTETLPTFSQVDVLKRPDELKCVWHL